MTDKPKRPLSAYFLWLNSAREQIKRENPGIKVTEIAKKGGEIWRSMKDKSEWEAKAVKAKEEYEVAMREFEANGGSTAANGAGKKRGKASKAPAKRSKKAESEEEDESE
ncbi:high mobility group protein D [Musca domestica]|uniref:HMG (High mobility group) box n=1 Tax=Musca domestica TaxID=7370 RepID=T1PFB4_MUSDO|nr:high mobility group protein D [Musca domestica]XP_011294019.1 high mobility group protein D [Musca domestica]